MGRAEPPEQQLPNRGFAKERHVTGRGPTWGARPWAGRGVGVVAGVGGVRGGQVGCKFKSDGIAGRGGWAAGWGDRPGAAYTGVVRRQCGCHQGVE